MISRTRAWLAASVALIAIIALPACSDSTSSSTSTSTTPIDVAPTTSAPQSTTTSTERDVSTTSVLFEFGEPTSIVGWSSVDDSVMGGISASTTTWIEPGDLLFSGMMTTESNGGFTSTLGPVDRSLGAKASGAIALSIDAIGDGRTYVMQLRSGPNGADRWIARFTPIAVTDRSAGNTVTIPFETFSPVDRFLRPTTPSSPLDPSTILQIGIYLIDGQVGDFRLAIRSITAIDG